MAVDNIAHPDGSIEAYIMSVRGTKTNFVRTATIHANDLSKIDTAKTAGSSVNGKQVAFFNGAVVGGNATGLANDATVYDCNVTIDNTLWPVSFAGSVAQTFTALITAINADLPGTEAAIVGGDIVITSTGTGNSSHVTIVDVDLFSNLTGFVHLQDPVDGGTGGNLKSSVTLDNGANAWEAYKTAVEVYDTADNEIIIKSKYSRGDLNAVFSDVEVETELDNLKAKVDALQELLDK